jgi:ABC transport system ATP-binding/permease protein
MTLSGGDKVALIGPNGAGKSTLLKIIAGIEHPDSGEVVFTKGLRIGYVSQDIEKFQGAIEDVVGAAAREMPWHDEEERYGHVRRVLGALGFGDTSMPAETLSGGLKRRLSIACALVKDPDVLLLDEPTNHLDLDSILWLEGFLLKGSFSFIVTSHDRVFLDRVATKTWEVSPCYPGGFFEIEEAYGEFVEIKKDFLEGQRQREKGLRSKLRREEEWLKSTPKARTTKSRSRIQEAARLKHEHSCIQRRNVTKKVQLDFACSGRQTRKLITARNTSKSFEENELFNGVDVTINKGDRLGIVGENGSGKSTLIKILASELKSDTGTVKYADTLKIFVFDQHREQLDMETSLRHALAPGGETVNYLGKPVHVNSWGQRFLFTKERLEMPLKSLSGGELARVHIARLMAEEADVLFLDEPTNDLDIDTLEILEKSLDDFPGAVVLVTHDRALMDRVVDNLLAVGDGSNGEIFDDTDKWLVWRKKKLKKKKEASSAKGSRRETLVKKKITYKETVELAGMEEYIHALEAELDDIAKEIEAPAIVADTDKMQEACDRLGQKQEELDNAFTRWQELEEKK